MSDAGGTGLVGDAEAKYKADDYQSAAVQFYKIAYGEIPSNPADQQRAQFWLGKTLYKLGFTGFKTGPGLDGLGAHFAHEWVILTNLLGLLLGFALLSKHFEDSLVPAALPRVLPDDWKGGFVLLALIFVLSAFLDNIAAALIGATIA